MDGLRTTLRRAIDALTLRDDVFRAMRDAPDAIEQGVILIVTIGVIAALAGAVGTALTGLTVPDVGAIQTTVTNGILDMPWAEELSAQEIAEAKKAATGQAEMNRQITQLFLPSAPMALVGVVTKPVGMVVMWLIYGLLAFACARLLGGRGTLTQTYGTTALAASPQLLSAFQLMPGVTTAGLGTWSLICNYLALKHTHGLSPGRTFWATILPFVVPIVLAIMFVGMVFVFGLIIGGISS